MVVCCCARGFSPSANKQAPPVIGDPLGAAGLVESCSHHEVRVPSNRPLRVSSGLCLVGRESSGLGLMRTDSGKRFFVLALFIGARCGGVAGWWRFARVLAADSCSAANGGGACAASLRWAAPGCRDASEGGRDYYGGRPAWRRRDRKACLLALRSCSGPTGRRHERGRVQYPGGALGLMVGNRDGVAGRAGHPCRRKDRARVNGRDGR